MADWQARHANVHNANEISFLKKELEIVKKYLQRTMFAEQVLQMNNEIEKLHKLKNLCMDESDED